MEIKNINEAWLIVTKTLRPTPEEAETTTITCEDFHSAVTVLQENGMSQIIQDWFMTSYQEELKSKIIPKFWNIFYTHRRDLYFSFPNAIDFLHISIQSQIPALRVLHIVQEYFLIKINSSPGTLKDVYKRMTSLKAEFFSVSGDLVFGKAGICFCRKLTSFFHRAFKSYQSKYKYVKEEEPVLECIFCGHSTNHCHCKQYIAAYDCTIKKLNDLQLLKKVVGDVPMDVAETAVKRHVRESCNGNFEVPMVKSLKLWLETIVFSWLSPFYGIPCCLHKIEPSNRDKLINILYDAYTSIRMEQLFDIVVEFPESLPALEDLKECLEINNTRCKLISSLKESMKNRLLHAGVKTSDILTAYMLTVKALRVLDQSGVMLQVISEPVCEYLRSREDTVQCIISSLQEDSAGESACELMKGVHVKQEVLSDEEDEDRENLCPDPVDVDPAETNNSQSSSEIIEILVTIYGSKELFLNEYRRLLADRILASFSYDTEQEIRCLELLKLRFGESELRFCEAMLKDIADSKRLNSHLNSGEVESYDSGDFPVNTMILSEQFWPSFKEEKLKLPDYISKHLQNYASAFEALKGNQTLDWKPHLGNVDLDIELKGRTLSLSVSPVLATILWHFQEKPRWTIPELSNKILLEASVLRRKITFWQNYGVLNEVEKDVFVLNENQNTTRESVVLVEEEEESITASTQDMNELNTTAPESVGLDEREEESITASSQDMKEEELNTIHPETVVLVEKEESITASSQDMKELNAAAPESVVLVEKEEESITASSQDMKEEELNTTAPESVVLVQKEEESSTASSQDMKEELQTLWSFIVGMLTNMESLPLERIHSMSRKFAVQGTSFDECSIQDMKRFLENKVRDKQLVYSAGMFKLPKCDS